jgi:hypothetical protein
VLQEAATQKKGSTQRCVRVPDENRFEKIRRVDDGWFNQNLLNLSGKKLSDGAVMVFVIGIMMDEFVNARANGEHCSPLQHYCDEESDDRVSGRAGMFPDHRLPFPFLIHENLEVTPEPTSRKRA